MKKAQRVAETIHRKVGYEHGSMTLLEMSKLMKSVDEMAWKRGYLNYATVIRIATKA